MAGEKEREGRKKKRKLRKWKEPRMYLSFEKKIFTKHSLTEDL